MSVEGRVKWFNKERCFGFIEDSYGAEVFVYHKGLAGYGDESLEEGQRVLMNVIAGKMGLEAENVRSI